MLCGHGFGCVVSVVWAWLWCGEYIVGVALCVFVNVVWVWFWVYAECSVGVALGVL